MPWACACWNCRAGGAGGRIPPYRHRQYSPYLLAEHGAGAAHPGRDALDWRLQQIHKDYIEDLWAVYRQQFGEWLGWALMRKQLSGALQRLRKRLGGARLARLQRLQELAFREHERGNSQAHEAWLAPLLTEYYDPMYRYQLEKHDDQHFLHVGDWDSCLAAARDWAEEASPGARESMASAAGAGQPLG
ncbi:tRNA 2-selenouridine synthase [Halomonas elongata]|uniref:tRNA 2-selenouridine synthase n=1 Tax=Halomonas elongata TaxID=2746 RepID=A0A1B8NYG0_HALEL|nr:tRNA 2-selenouridine synthase [Halomonas elongata]